MACQAPFTETNVIWSRRGVPWALYGLGFPDPDEPSPNAGEHHHQQVASALSELRGEALVLSLHGSGGAEPVRLLAVELCASIGRPIRSPLLSAIGAAGAEVAGAFGIPSTVPITREASARCRDSGELTARLCQQLPLRPVSSEEMGSIRSPCTREPEESKQHGYLRLDAEGGPAYQSFLVVSRVSGDLASREWARTAEEISFPVSWCLRIRPGPGSPEAPRLATAIVFSIRAANLVELNKRVAKLRRDLGARGLSLERPRRRQLALRAAMRPAQAFDPALSPYLQLLRPEDLGPVLGPQPILERRAPARAIPYMTVSASALAGYLLRIRRGPRRGVQVPLNGEIVVGRGGADLDLGDPSTATRHAAVGFAGGRVVLRNLATSPSVRLAGRQVEGEVDLDPGQSFLVGESELILLTNRQAGTLDEAPPSGCRRTWELTIGAEDQTDRWNVCIEAGEDATCADVTGSIVEYLGLSREAEHCAYRERRGLYLRAALAWRQSGVLRGDILQVGVVAEGSPALPEDGLDRNTPSSLMAAGRPPSVSSASSETRLGSARIAISRPPLTVLAPAPMELMLPSIPQEPPFRGSGALWQLLAVSGAVITSIIVAVALPGFRWIALAGVAASSWGSSRASCLKPPAVASSAASFSLAWMTSTASSRTA